MHSLYKSKKNRSLETSVFVCATDTLYGICTSAFNKKNVERIYDIKGRDSSKPFIILISHNNDLKKFGISLSHIQKEFLRHVWPAKVSVIFSCPSKKFDYLHRGVDSLAFRMPNKRSIQDILEVTGPLVAPSANPEGLPPAETITEAREYFGEKIDEYISGGKSKGNKHLLRVVRVAKFLAQKTKADEYVAVAGAFLHDTALPSGNDYDYIQNKRIVKDLLKDFNLSQNELNGIAECVASHEGTINPKTLEAKVVHDSDVLEKTGLLGIIRHTWKLTNSGKINYKNVTDKDVKVVTDHIEWRRKKLQTPIAKKIGKYLSIPINKEKAKIIVSVSSDLAFNSVVTEIIAVALRKHLNKKENEKLKEQLNLAYLNKFK
jgi:L-threonylcarbamoyladenylate synthase